MACLRIVMTAILLLVTMSGSHVSGAVQPEASVQLTAEEQQWLKRHPVIKLAPDPDFKPIEFFDDKGEYRGASADIIRLLEQKLGIAITVVRLQNWDEVMMKFKSREVDLLGAMVRTPNRERFALFTDTLVTVPGGIFARSGSRTNLTLDDLKEKKVAVVSNYAAHDILKNRFPEIRLEVVPDVSTALAKTSLGMVDFYVENMANATFYAQEAGITNLQLAGKTDFDYRWGMGIRKDWPELQGILNKGLAAIDQQERSRALQKWIFVEDMHWRPTRTFVIGVVAALLGLLLIFAAYWNYALKKTVRSRTASLQDELRERKKVEQALKALSLQLEDRVRERTADLEREIAERIKSEQAVIASEQRFRELFENVADPVYIADMTGKIIAANDQACHELCYSPDELLSRNISDLDAVDDEEMVSARLRGFSPSSSVTFESVHRRKDGTTFPAEVKVRLIDFDNRPAVIGVARNISERKKAEEERIKLEQQLLHAQKLESLGVLAGGIAHDFNNILTSIIGNNELALMRLSPESPALENLQRIEASAVRAADLARQMLAYSGKGKFVIESIDLNRLLKEMGHMLEVAISKRVLLRYNLARELPAVEVDATQIRQIIMNLVINGSEAIGDRDGVIAISTGSLECKEDYLKEAWLIDPIPEGSYVAIEVSDTGCGMDKATLSRIFDPFFTTKFTGRGLGMAAVLGIVRSHKGAIKVYSEPGRGTTFKVLLPAAGESPAGAAGTEPEADAWQGQGVVLLVDDEDDIRTIGTEFLHELGFEVITARDGCEALEMYQAHRDIALVLLDLTMPRMDGEQCFRELRRIDPSVKVIMSSGFSEHEVSRKFVGKGLAGLIQKPYKLSGLRSVIRASESPRPETDSG